MLVQNPSLLREFLLFEFDEPKPSDKPDGIMILSGIIQKANQKNANGRIYPRHILVREDQKMQESIKARGALGEADHPATPTIKLENVSHLLRKTWWDGDNLMGEIEILDTPKGKIIESLIKRNVRLGISSRGLGSTKITNEGHEIVEDDYNMICYDLVSTPSTFDAWMKNKNLQESFEYKKFVANNRNILLESTLDEILNLGDAKL